MGECDPAAQHKGVLLMTLLEDIRALKYHLPLDAYCHHGRE